MNTIPTLKVGESVIWNGREGTIRLYDDDLSVIKFTDGLTQILPRNAIRQALAAQELVISVPQSVTTLLTDAPESEVNEALRIDAYCRELDKQRFPNSDISREEVIFTISEEIGDTAPPGKSTISRWYQRWLKNNRNPYSHLKRLKTHTANRRTSDEVVDLMKQVIEDVYMQRHKPTKKATYAEFVKQFHIHGYDCKCPSERTFRRVLDDYNKIDIIEGREGRSAARAAERRVKSRFDISFPLERVELDSAHINLPLNDDNGNYVGLVTIHLVIDCFSRAILGYALHFGDRKETSGAIIHAIRYALSVKKDPDYPMHGRPFEIVHDGGPAYIDLRSQSFFAALGSVLTTTPNKAGWKKPFVERFIRTLREDFLTQVPGYLGKREADGYSDDNLKDSAKLSVTEFRNRLHDYIVNVYHNQPHKGLKNSTPKRVWEEAIKYSPPIMPSNPDDLRMLRGMRVTRTLYRHSGVTCAYEDFHSHELEMMYDECAIDAGVKKGIKVDILFDPLDATAVSVVHPKSAKLIEAVNVDLSHHDMSFAELNALRKANKALIGERTAYSGKEATKRIKRKYKKGPEVPLDTVDAPVNLLDLFGDQQDQPKAKRSGNTKKSSTQRESSNANAQRAKEQRKRFAASNQ